jgi:phosphatidylglycerol:prolipoprotein diacylglycerol transferase
MHPILFKIGSLTFYSHGVFAVAGIIIGALFVFNLARRNNLSTEFLFDNIVFTVLLGIIGARLTYFILYPSSFDNWTKIFFLWEGGLVSYGGFILGGVTLTLLLRKQGQPVLQWLSLTSISFFLGLAIGRLGDIFAGEYAGISSNSRWLTILPGNSLVLVPFYEALLCLFIFVTLAIAYKKYFDRLSDGTFFYLAFCLYVLGRFIIDFGRDERDILYHLSLGQIVSLIIFIVTLFFVVFRSKKRNQNGQV